MAGGEAVAGGFSLAVETWCGGFNATGAATIGGAFRGLNALLRLSGGTAPILGDQTGATCMHEGGGSLVAVAVLGLTARCGGAAVAAAPSATAAAGP